MEKVVLIVSDFVKELLVCCSTEFLEGWEVWLTESTFLVVVLSRRSRRSDGEAKSQRKILRLRIICLVQLLIHLPSQHSLLSVEPQLQRHHLRLGSRIYISALRSYSLRYVRSKKQSPLCQ